MDTLKSGHRLYNGHSVTNMHYFTPEIRTLCSGPKGVHISEVHCKHILGDKLPITGVTTAITTVIKTTFYLQLSRGASSGFRWIHTSQKTTTTFGTENHYVQFCVYVSLCPYNHFDLLKPCFRCTIILSCVHY